MNVTKNVFWISAVLVIIIVFGTIYLAIQQTQRSNANYPQVQLAQDVAAGLDEGDRTAITEQINIEKSLAPFVIIYDKSGNAATGSGYLGTELATISADVLKTANGKPYSTLTWEPKSGVRIAAVIVAAKDYFVLSGRSLREVEQQERQTFSLVGTGGVVTLVVLGVTFVLHHRWNG